MFVAPALLAICLERAAHNQRCGAHGTRWLLCRSGDPTPTAASATKLQTLAYGSPGRERDYARRAKRPDLRSRSVVADADGGASADTGANNVLVRVNNSAE